MSVSIFTDKNHKPTFEEIDSIVGNKQNFLKELDSFIQNNYSVKGDSLFYGKKYWGFRYKNSSKVLLLIFPKKDEFDAVVVIGPTIDDKVLGIDISEKSKTAFQNARQYKEGRSVVINVENEKDIDDIKKLIILKAPIKKQKTN